MKYLADPLNLAMDVNVKDNEGHTPLHHVAHNGRLEMVKFFIERCGADVYSQNKYGKTPRHQTSCFEVALYLDKIMKDKTPPSSYQNAPPIQKVGRRGIFANMRSKMLRQLKYPWLSNNEEEEEESSEDE